MDELARFMLDKINEATFEETLNYLGECIMEDKKAGAEYTQDERTLQHFRTALTRKYCEVRARKRAAEFASEEKEKNEQGEI